MEPPIILDTPQDYLQMAAQDPEFAVGLLHTLYRGARGSVVVKALCYKPEGRGFDTR
jgi:polyphosphate kinase